MGRRVLVLLCAATIMAGCSGAPAAVTDAPAAPGTGRLVARPPSTEPATSAPTTTTTAPATDPSASGGCAPLPSDTYDRPYADTAPWNVPVCSLAADSRSADWASRFWYYSRFNAHMADDPTKSDELGNYEVMFGLDADSTRDFSVAVYDVRQATTTARVFKRSGWPGKFNVPNGTSIPWNPSWRASGGSDSMMVIIDPTTGSQWSFWGLAQSYYGLPVNDTQCWGDILSVGLPGGGFRPGIDLCTGGFDRVTKASSPTTLSDYRVYGGNNPMTRGVGVDRFAMLVTPAEVATGQIRHALQMPVYNTMTGGTVCSGSETSAAFGSTCGQAVAPAGNFERRSSDEKGCREPVTDQLTSVQYRQTTIPSGMRFALKMTPTQIEQWLDSRGYTGQKRATARAFATALVDYGWIVTDTSCYGANFQVSGGANAQTATAWRALGITGDGRDLLKGLLTKDRIWTVAPPTNHCVDGTDTKFACPADSVTYP
jgi:hypothetical protein